MSRNIVVIGAGQAAASFAARLRELDTASTLTIIGDEPAIPYQRPPLSKKYMTGEMTADRLELRPADWYAAHDIALLTGIAATAIDRASRTVRLADGRALPWDALLIATGSTPRRLPAASGGDLAGVHTLRNLADADRLGAEFRPGRRLLVIGGGYIGLEAAAVAAAKGLHVTVAEMAPRILQRVASPETAAIVRAEHQRHGVEILESVTLTGLEGRHGQVCAATFADGRRIDIDFALAGIGVTPNTGLAAAAGLTIDNGIAVDLACRTSDPDIYSAGDCASFHFNDHRIRLESVQNAIDQGDAAARALCGEAVEYRPVPWFWSDQYEMKLQIAGLNMGYDRTVTRPGQREDSSSVWYFANNRFIAVDAINDSRTYMIGKRLLETGKTLTAEQAADPATDLKALM